MSGWSPWERIECPHCEKEFSGYEGEAPQIDMELTCPHCKGVSKVDDVEYEVHVFVKRESPAPDTDKE